MVWQHSVAKNIYISQFPLRTPELESEETGKNMEGNHHFFSSEDRSVVFGASLADIRRRGGACLPHPIFEILRFLRVHAAEAVGIFRKNGVKSRISECLQFVVCSFNSEFISDL